MQTSTRRFGSGIVFADPLSNIAVSGTMLHEEAFIIAEKLHVDGFVASNGWLEMFKNAHNISTMTVAGEDADVSPQTLASQRTIQRTD